MKTYIVYVKGYEAGYIKARGHNEAEAKAIQKYAALINAKRMKAQDVSVCYTEL